MWLPHLQGFQRVDSSAGVGGRAQDEQPAAWCDGFPQLLGREEEVLLRPTGDYDRLCSHQAGHLRVAHPEGRWDYHLHIVSTLGLPGFLAGVSCMTSRQQLHQGGICLCSTCIGSGLQGVGELVNRPHTEHNLSLQWAIMQAHAIRLQLCRAGASAGCCAAERSEWTSSTAEQTSSPGEQTAATACHTDCLAPLLTRISDAV